MPVTLNSSFIVELLNLLPARVKPKPSNSSIYSLSTQYMEIMQFVIYNNILFTLVSYCYVEDPIPTDELIYKCSNFDRCFILNGFSLNKF